MNLELLDPFGRQVPDRIDATIELPSALHFRSYDGSSKEDKKNASKNSEPSDWKSAYHVAFNRRGTYVAVGYGSGTVAVHNVLSRTLSALYRNQDESASPSNAGLGISSVSWSRRSRTLLAGSSGDATVHLYDTSHSNGPEEANVAWLKLERESEDDPTRGTRTVEEQLVHHTFEQTQTTSFADVDQRFEFLEESREGHPLTIQMGEALPLNFLTRHANTIPSDARGLPKFPSVTFQFPHKVSGSLQINPRIPTSGLAVLEDGSLVIFWEHASVWVLQDKEDADSTTQPIIIPIWKSPNEQQKVTCAAFDTLGDRIYAATMDGKTMGFDITGIWNVFTTAVATAATNSTSELQLPVVRPHFTIDIPGASSSWHLLVSRNGKFFVINSADGALRLFSTQECWETPRQVEKPAHTFQDVVSKVKFSSCDLSGDGEYVVGGANGGDYKYEVRDALFSVRASHSYRHC